MLWVIFDLYIGYFGNKFVVELLYLFLLDDWLIVVGDVVECIDEICWLLDLLWWWFVKVIWVLGNYELWIINCDLM